MSSERRASPSQRMQCVRRAEPDLRHLQSVADAHQAVLVRNLEALERELAMAAVLLGSQDRNAAHDAPPRLAAVEEKGRQPLARIVRGLRDEDEVLRRRGTRDEPLAPVDDPAIAA